MTAAQLLAILQVLSALTPTITLLADGVKDLTGKPVDVENMTVSELLALKDELALTDPATWPDLQFKSPVS